MATKLKKQSGIEVIKILANKFNFSVKRTKGSHTLLTKTENNEKIVCVVPRHKELKMSTLRGILEQAKVPEEEFAGHQ